MEKTNLSDLFNKKFFYEMSKQELMNQHCANICWGDGRDYCEKCKKCYQDWTKNYVLEENELEEFRLNNKKIDYEESDESLIKDFYDNKWPKLREFLEPRCMYICNYDDPKCENCNHIKRSLLINIEKICFCEECYLKYKTEYIESGIGPDDLVYVLHMQHCDICKNFICPHYFSLQRLCDYCIFNNMIDKKYQIKKYIDNLKVNFHQKYSPEGKSALEAKEHFNDIQNDNQKK